MRRQRFSPTWSYSDVISSKPGGRFPDERSFLSLGMIPGAHGLIALHPEIYIRRKAATKTKVIQLYIRHQASTDFSYLDDGCFSESSTTYNVFFRTSLIPWGFDMISTMEEDPKNLGSLNEHWNLSQLLACKEGKYNPRSYMHTTPCLEKQCAFFPKAFSTILLAHKPSRKNRHNLSRCEKYLESFEAHWFRKLKYLGTPWRKKNGWNPKSWRFGLDDVPFQLAEFLGSKCYSLSECNPEIKVLTFIFPIPKNFKV